MSLTPRQKDTLDYIVDFQEEYGFSPSYHEIAAGIGVNSIGRVAALVTALKDRGYVTTRSGGKRSIEILRTSVLDRREDPEPAP
jgi:repressor LexA